MTDQLRSDDPDDPDDTAGHIFRNLEDGEREASDDDVAGHLSPRSTGVHDPVTDDAEGRRFPAAGGVPADGAGEPDDDSDDVAGHGLLRPTDPK